jgi:hypothetical protein
MSAIVELILKIILKKFGVTEEKIASLTPTVQARVLAYIIVPTAILLLLVGAVSRGWVGIDLERAFAIAELKTETVGATTSSKRGVVVIAESENSIYYQIPLAQNTSKIWSSLDKKAAEDNKSLVTLDSEKLKIDAPFIGVSEPVAFVVDGELGTEIMFRGSIGSVEDWRLSPQRNVSLVFWPLAICFLAYGIAVVRGAPIVEGDKNDASQVRAEPDKD